MQTNSVYTLDSEKLHDALAILDRELEVFGKLVQVQQESAPRVKLVIYAFSIGLAIIAISMSHGWISPETGFVVTATFSLVYVVVSIVFSVDQFRALRRLRKTQKSLGLEPEKSFVGWKEAKARLLPFILYLLMLLVAAVLFYASDQAEEFNPWICDLGILVIAIGLSIFPSFIGRRNLLLYQHRLDSAKKLQSTLLSQQRSQTDKNGELTISIPESEYKKIARIERALVNLDRQQAIKQSSKKAGPSVLAVQQSAGVLKAKSELEPSARVRVQTLIDELSTNPRPANSRQTPDGDWRMPVAETGWDISYALAENPSRILIQDLVQTGQSERQEK